MIRVVRAGDLGGLYDKSGWLSQGEPACNRRLAEFVFRNLQGSDYAALGYGSVEAASVKLFVPPSRYQHWKFQVSPGATAVGGLTGIEVTSIAMLPVGPTIKFAGWW